MIQDTFVRQRARQLYWQGYPVAEISRLMGINQNTIHSWKKRDQWDETPRFSVSRSPWMRDSFSSRKNRIKQAGTLRKLIC